jgi:hypothetical protein
MKRYKLLLATVGATALLGTLVGAATARNLSSSSQTFRAVFRTVIIEGPGGEIRCNMSLEGSLHTRTIAKVAGSLVGYLTRADLGACESGTATILRETLPWHMRYASFTATLPNISSIRFNVIRFSIRGREPFASCLYVSTVASPNVLTIFRDTLSGTLETALLGGSIPGTCGFNSGFESTRDPVTVLGTTTRITLTLI